MYILCIIYIYINTHNYLSPSIFIYIYMHNEHNIWVDEMSCNRKAHSSNPSADLRNIA